MLHKRAKVAGSMTNEAKTGHLKSPSVPNRVLGILREAVWNRMVGNYRTARI